MRKHALPKRRTQCQDRDDMTEGVQQHDADWTTSGRNKPISLNGGDSAEEIQLKLTKVIKKELEDVKLRNSSAERTVSGLCEFVHMEI